MMDIPSFCIGLMAGIGLASIAALIAGISRYIMDKYFPKKIKEVKKK